MSNRYYYIDKQSKKIMHFAAKQDNPSQGFDYAGMSSMKVVSACGFYANNQDGYSIIDGDEPATDPESAEE